MMRTRLEPTNGPHTSTNGVQQRAMLKETGAPQLRQTAILMYLLFSLSMYQKFTIGLCLLCLMC